MLLQLQPKWKILLKKKKKAKWFINYLRSQHVDVIVANVITKNVEKFYQRESGDHLYQDVDVVATTINNVGKSYSIGILTFGVF